MLHRKTDIVTPVSPLVCKVWISKTLKGLRCNISDADWAHPQQLKSLSFKKYFKYDHTFIICFSPKPLSQYLSMWRAASRIFLGGGERNLEKALVRGLSAHQRERFQLILHQSYCSSTLGWMHDSGQSDPFSSWSNQLGKGDVMST